MRKWDKYTSSGNNRDQLWHNRSPAFPCSWDTVPSSSLIRDNPKLMCWIICGDSFILSASKKKMLISKYTKAFHIQSPIALTMGFFPEMLSLCRRSLVKVGMESNRHLSCLIPLLLLLRTTYSRFLGSRTSEKLNFTHVWWQGDRRDLSILALLFVCLCVQRGGFCAQHQTFT